MIDLDLLLLRIQQWATEAGNIQLEYFRGDRLEIQCKRDDTAADVVTAADKASETYLINQIKRCYPDHAILSEESGAIEGDKDCAEFRWIIDPLDGTTNFSNGLPLFAVSIAIERYGEPLFGVVYVPYLKEMFHAIFGCGAWLNHQPIHASAKNDLAESVVSTGFPVDKALTDDNNLADFAKIMPQVRGIRRLGSAAVDLCYVAAGYLDAYWEIDLHQWDIAAGALIAREAGAIVSPLRNDRGVSILATAPALHSKLLSQLKKA
jgi:myo-inositol-1(or 4)-monophosphatase